MLQVQQDEKAEILYTNLGMFYRTVRTLPPMQPHVLGTPGACSSVSSQRLISAYSPRIIMPMLPQKLGLA
jgi:hypothetical protein